MNVEWTITGIILLGAMAAGGISLYLKRRKESKIPDSLVDALDPNENRKNEK